MENRTERPSHPPCAGEGVDNATAEPWKPRLLRKPCAKRLGSSPSKPSPRQSPFINDPQQAGGSHYNSTHESTDSVKRLRCRSSVEPTAVTAPRYRCQSSVDDLTESNRRASEGDQCGDHSQRRAVRSLNRFRGTPKACGWAPPDASQGDSPHYFLTTVEQVRGAPGPFEDRARSPAYSSTSQHYFSPKSPDPDTASPARVSREEAGKPFGAKSGQADTVMRKLTVPKITSRPLSPVGIPNCVERRLSLPLDVSEDVVDQLFGDLEIWREKFGASTRMKGNVLISVLGNDLGEAGKPDACEDAFAELQNLVEYNLGASVSVSLPSREATPRALPAADYADISDPEVVFGCCDTDESGSLGLHELRFALHAFGLFPPLDTLQEWMQGEESVDVVEFKVILSNKLNADLPKCMKRARTVPYSLRGVSLQQLTQLDKTFVASGWIEERCSEYNGENEQAITRGEAFRMEPNLYALDRFVIVPVTSSETSSNGDPKCRDLVPQELCDQAGLPIANRCCSYSELVNPLGVRIDAFVSHFWGHPFSETMCSLRKWSLSAHWRFHRRRSEDMVFWLCFLALNQHQKGEEVGSSPEEGPFNAALMQAKCAVMILDEQVNPFQRIWCLFEVKRLTDLRKPFELICSFGPVHELLNGSNETSEEEASDCVEGIGAALEKVCAFDAKASSEADKLAIWHRVADPALRRMPLETAKTLFTETSFRRFDMKMRSLLAEPLFRFSMLGKEFGKAFWYIGMGAAFGAQDLELLQHWSGWDITQLQVPVMSGGHKTTDWTLLHCAAYFGHYEAVESLISRNAEINYATIHGYAALHHAARNGHESITKFLLDKKASMTSAKGICALNNCAHQGYAKVCDILLHARANVNNATNRGQGTQTVLHVASGQGHDEVVKVLLKHGVDLLTVTADGSNALHKAAQYNHINVFSAIVDSELRDVTPALVARTKAGRSCLDIAISEGHKVLADLIRFQWT